MKLLGYNISGDTNQTIGQDVISWSEEQLNGNVPFLVIEDNDLIPSDYTNISSIESWGNYGEFVLTQGEINKEIKKLLPSDLLDLTPLEKEFIIELGVMNNNRFYKEKTITQTTTSSSLQTYDSVILDLEEGTYEILYMLVGNINSTSKSFKYSCRVDDVSILNGITSDPLSLEFKDKSDEVVFNVSRDIQLTGGNHNFSILFASEGGLVTIYYSQIKIVKVG